MLIKSCSHKILVFIMPGILLFPLGCDNNDNPTGTNAEVSQLVLAEVRSVNTSDSTSGVVCNGVVISNEIPLFEYFKLGQRIFDDTKFFSFETGRINFQNFGEPVSANLNPLIVEVKTSLGLVKGSETSPELINKVTLSHNDTLRLGESLTISWEGSNADFYNIGIVYIQINPGGIVLLAPTFISQSSVTYDESIFNREGSIDLRRITPINGPFPGHNSKSNMSGDGSGFLYYYAQEFRIDQRIIVTSGNSKSNDNQLFLSDSQSNSLSNKLLKRLELLNIDK